MKPEPLKGKVHTRYCSKCGTEHTFRDTIYVKDVKSAVEWLKEEIKNINNQYLFNPKDIKTDENTIEIIDKIDKAFEDVMKK